MSIACQDLTVRIKTLAGLAVERESHRDNSIAQIEEAVR